MKRITSYLNALTLTAGYILIWGLSLAIPTTDIFPNHPLLYAPMRAILDSEVLWGMIFIMIGMFGIWLAVQNKARKGSFVIAVASIFLSSLFILGDPSRPAWALFGMSTVFNLMHWRFGHDRPY